MKNLKGNLEKLYQNNTIGKYINILFGCFGQDNEIGGINTEVENLKGNLDRLYENKIVKDYLNQNLVFGYLGHEHRTEETDRELEDLLKYNLGLNPKLEDMIATWMCSRNARHFMDLCDDIEFFRENIVENLM